MTRRGWLLFTAMCVIWGIPYLLIRVAVRELTPATLVFGRCAVAVLLLVPVAALGGQLRPLVARWKPLLAYTLVEIAVPWVLLSSAEVHLSSSLTAILIGTVPLVSAVALRATGDDERLSRRRLAGLLLGFIGVGALVGLDVSGASPGALLELALVVVCYAIGPIILARYLVDLPALGVVAASLALTAVGYAPVAALQFPSAVPSAGALGAVVALGVICSGVAFLVFVALVREVGPGRATVITYVNPAVAALLGVSLLGEALTVGMGVGFVFVLAGSILATRRVAPRDGSASSRRAPVAAPAIGEP